MGYLKRIDNAFNQAPTLHLTPSSKLVFISDCHRGVGNSNDNFLKNELIFLSALQTYYRQGYTYIELGDGDELWENRSLKTIQQVYNPIFCMLRQFLCDGRLYLLYGNHDHEKSQYKNCDFTYYSGIILKDCQTGRNIYLTHGHQADFLNSSLWKVARFLVRYVWRPLELLGIPDPTSAATNYTLKEKTEKRLNQWAKNNDTILITGHTHRAMTGNRNNPYFNSGCCVYPGSITALELASRHFTLVNWTLGIGEDRSLHVTRELLAPPVGLDEIFL